MERIIETVPRILLAEDSLRDAELAISALQEYHLANEILHVRDGDEALDYLFRRGKFAGMPIGLPAVLLLDLKMPKVDGLEVLRQIRADPNLNKLAVVMMTSSREEQDLVRSYELGVNSYVVKPIQFIEFVEAVKQIGAYWALINEPSSRSVPKNHTAG